MLPMPRRGKIAAQRAQLKAEVPHWQVATHLPASPTYPITAAACETRGAVYCQTYNIVLVCLSLKLSPVNLETATVNLCIWESLEPRLVKEYDIGSI